MAPEEQLEWEARAGRPAAAAAITVALLLALGSLIYPIAAVGSQPNTLALTLLKLDSSPADLLIPGTLQALGYLLLPIPLLYLYRATRARRAEMLPAARYLAVFGPVATAIAFIAHQFALIGAAHDFADEKLVSHYPLGVPGGLAQAVAPVVNAEARAYNIYSDAIGSPVVVALQYAGALAVAFALVLISLNAMRAGLLSRFMGSIGIIIGVLTIIPLLGQFSIVMTIFWLGALGVLFLNRSPNGRGPAWDAVEQVPWPTVADQRAKIQEAQGGKRAPTRPRDAEPDDVDADEDEDYEYAEDGADDASAANGHPRSRKRKRKRRR